MEMYQNLGKCMEGLIQSGQYLPHFYKTDHSSDTYDLSKAFGLFSLCSFVGIGENWMNKNFRYFVLGFFMSSDSFLDTHFLALFVTLITYLNKLFFWLLLSH